MFFLLTLLLACTGAYDCTPNPDIVSSLLQYADVQPLCKGYVDVTKAPYSAKGDGVTDDSAAIQQAVIDAKESDLVTFFPANKVFLISQSIRCIKTSDSFNDAYHGFQLHGSTKGNRPVLKLADGSIVEDNIFIYFALITTWGQNKPPDHYSAQIRNIDIDAGNNPQVSALSMSGAQWCSIEDVKITGESFYAGIQGLPGSGGFSGNVEIDGGTIGVWQQQYRPVPIVTNLILSNQEKAGIWLQITRGPLVIAGFEIYGPQNPNYDYRAIIVSGDEGWNNMEEGDGSLALEDGVILLQGSNSVAVENTAQNLAFRNVYIHADYTVTTTQRTKMDNWNKCGTWPDDWNIDNCQYHSIYLQCSGSGSLPYNYIENWVFTQQGSVINVAGQMGAGTYPPSNSDFHQCGNSAGPPSGLAQTHSWDASLLPSWEDEDLVDIVTDYGATQSWVKGNDDDGAKIQQALDDVADPSHPNYNKTVFIPVGTYDLYTTLNLHAGTRMIGTNKVTKLETAKVVGQWQSGEPILQSEDADAPTGMRYGIILQDFNLRGASHQLQFNLQTDKILYRDMVNQNTGENQFALPTKNAIAMLSGHAGGAFYGMAIPPLNFDTTPPDEWSADFSLLYVTGTSNKLSFYEVVTAHQACRSETLIEDSSNINFHAWKFESVSIGAGPPTPGEITYGGSMATFKNVDNLQLFGGTGNFVLNFTEIATAIVEFNYTDPVQMWSMVRRVDGAEIPNGQWIRNVNANGMTEVSDKMSILYYNPDPTPYTILEKEETKEITAANHESGKRSSFGERGLWEKIQQKINRKAKARMDSARKG